MPLPELPPELLDMILREAFPPTSSEATNQFHRIREAGEERALFSWSTTAGKSWLPFIRSLLFFAPHVSTKKRADKLLASLQLAFPEDPASKGYLSRLVSRLSLDIRERELPHDEDVQKKYNGADGVSPLQVVELAVLLPNLRSLVVSAADKGGWAGDPAMLNALKRFKKVQHLEVTSSGLGWQNALAVFSQLDELESLKFRGSQPGWTFLSETTRSGATFKSSFNPSVPFSFGKTLTSLVLSECTLTEAEFEALFTSLAPASLLPANAQSVGGADALPPPILRHLTVHHLRTRAFSPTTNEPTQLPFPPHLLISHLSPLMPHLHTFHLTLFERPILSHNDERNLLVATGHLKEGHLTGLADSGHRPGNALAALLGPDLCDLTLGGALCVSAPALFDALDRAAAGSASGEAGARVKRLTLVQCAEVERAGDGLKPKEFVQALDREWASGLEVVDVRGMEFALPTDENTPAWGEEALAALKKKADEVSAGRRRLGQKGLEVLVDEESIETARKNREWEERRAKRTRTKSTGRGGSASTSTSAGMSNKKRKKAV
ncbi:hypothetical protein JCM6882_007273 [Rhodosporidiobolus microsporus]